MNSENSGKQFASRSVIARLRKTYVPPFFLLLCCDKDAILMFCQCRLRYEKLQRIQHERAIQDVSYTAAVIDINRTNHAGPSRVVQDENPNGGTSTFTFTSNMEQDHTFQPSGSTTPTTASTKTLTVEKPTSKAKGKEKEKVLAPADAASESNSTGDVAGQASATNGFPNATVSAAESAVPQILPRPRPRPKPRKKAVSNDSHLVDNDVNQVPTPAQNSSEPAASLSTPEIIQAPASSRGRKRKATENVANELDKQTPKKSKKARKGVEEAEFTGSSHAANAVPTASSINVNVDSNLESEPAGTVQQLRRGRSRKLMVPVEPVEIPTSLPEAEQPMAKRGRGRKGKA